MPDSSPTILRFEVEARVPPPSAIVLARQLSDAPWEMPADPHFGGVPVEPVISQPRAMTPEGEPRFDLFALVLKRPSELGKFAIGEKVILASGPSA